jgi:acyl-CoA thioesterase YciA
MEEKGLLALQTLAMPANTNANGDIFGGWLVSQMDLAGGIFAKKEVSGRVVTVAMNKIEFKCPVQVGDVVSCFVKKTSQGRTSMHLYIEVWTNNFKDQIKQQVASGEFVFVAIDEKGRPKAIN